MTRHPSRPRTRRATRRAATAVLVLAAAVLVLPGGAAQAGFSSGPAPAAANSSWTTGSAPAMSGPITVGRYDVGRHTVPVSWPAAPGTLRYLVTDDHGYSRDVGTATGADVPAPVGVTDTITVTASNGFTASVQVTTVANDRAVLTVAVPGITQVDTTWTALPGATGYEVQLATSADFTTGIIAKAVSGTSASFTAADGVQAGRTYWARVRALGPTPASWTDGHQLATPTGVYVNAQVNGTNPWNNPAGQYGQAFPRTAGVDWQRGYVWQASASTNTLSRFDMTTRQFTTFTLPGSPETMGVDPATGSVVVQMIYQSQLYVQPEIAARNPDGTAAGAQLVPLGGGYRFGSGVTVRGGTIFLSVYGPAVGYATLTRSGATWTATPHPYPGFQWDPGLSSTTISTDGRYVASAAFRSTHRTLYVYDTATGAHAQADLESTQADPNDNPVVVPFTGPDGQARWLVRGEGYLAHVVGLTGQPLESVTLPGRDFGYDATSHDLYVTAQDASTLWAYPNGDVHAPPRTVTLPSGISTIDATDPAYLWAIGVSPGGPVGQTDWGNVRVVEIPRP